MTYHIQTPCNVTGCDGPIIYEILLEKGKCVGARRTCRNLMSFAELLGGWKVRPTPTGYIGGYVLVTYGR